MSPHLYRKAGLIKGCLRDLKRQVENVFGMCPGRFWKEAKGKLKTPLMTICKEMAAGTLRVYALKMHFSGIRVANADD